MFRAGFIYERMGNRDKALFWLERALQNGYALTEMESEPGLRELRSDQRFKNLQQKYKK